MQRAELEPVSLMQNFSGLGFRTRARTVLGCGRALGRGVSGAELRRRSEARGALARRILARSRVRWGWDGAREPGLYVGARGLRGGAGRGGALSLACGSAGPARDGASSPFSAFAPAAPCCSLGRDPESH